MKSPLRWLRSLWTRRPPQPRPLYWGLCPVCPEGCNRVADGGGHEHTLDTETNHRIMVQVHGRITYIQEYGPQEPLEPIRAPRRWRVASERPEQIH